MNYLTLANVSELHDLQLNHFGGLSGVRDAGILESAVAQPAMAIYNHELYATLVEKAAAIGFSLVKNHAFFDGNKRIGHSALETFLVLNGFEIQANVDEQEALIVGVAAGTVSREQLVQWLQTHLVELPD